MQKRLLIIDDDEDIRLMLKVFFEPRDYIVSTLGKVDDIFEAYNKYQPDLILLDYKMPEGNGDKICHQLKSNPGTFHVPVIMISGFPKSMLEKNHHGWDGVLSKPFDLPTLEATVKRFLNRRV
ncbi:two-component system response regulator [Mucilaginibacter sp. BT774]|uniref:response regulator n=1 Tax=Mucilaginibacter sp. BT774 TaxID=3062276 RepID=UPI002676BC6E|nr:response regulator [Mucilaginibacter sp. BT774]MDO3628704.1 response regulator [Mucilaginibacter sp. BT774]